MPRLFSLTYIKRVFNRLNPQQLALAFMLLTLHGVLLWGFTTPVYKALLICHYGFFLVWQPIWRTQEKLTIPSTLLFLTGGVLLVSFVSWWLIAFWLTVLFGLLGGRVFSTTAKVSHRNYLLATSYILAVLLLWVVPKLLNASADVAATAIVVEYVMPLLPLYILFSRSELEDSKDPPVLDFFYTLLLILAAVILVLASFVMAAGSQDSYTEIMLKVMFGLALALVILSWLWNPHAGFTGIGQLLSRYLLSVGLPFEQWVKNIAVLAEQKDNPLEFTQSAMHELASLPWVSGIQWINADSEGKLGATSKNQIELHFHDFHLVLHTHKPLTPALTIHVKLLTQILGEFYEAKRREETLRQNAYVQAVYETGSRLTHDIKNLVQSMGALCSAAEQTSEEDSARLLVLMRRQLPLLNQRLTLTLGKLEAPALENHQRITLANWWDGLKSRHASQTNIQFITLDFSDMEVNAEVLDSVVENLLQNAIRKAKSDVNLSIRVELDATDEFSLDVSDNGKPMPVNVANTLFKKHVSSEGGLGIGLYHAARQAQQAGYALDLMQNKDGEVRFRVKREEV
ncbi:MAG: ATP-binding protein [Methylophilaceae bacterium]